MINMSNHATMLTMPSERQLVITRTFDAPRWLVFDVTTKPEHIVHWWGLRDHEMTVCEVDLRPGGKWRYVSRTPEGEEFAFSGEYRKVVAPERIVYTEGYEAMPGHDYLVTATFTENDGKTTMNAVLQYQSQEDRDGHVNSGMEVGMRESHDRLAERLADETTSMSDAIVITREFDVPRERVWAAWTDPQQVSRWWGPKGWSSGTNRIDLRVGGKYIFNMQMPDGQNVWSCGRYLDIVPLERLVCTDSFSDEQGNIASGTEYGLPEDAPLEYYMTVELAEVNGKTRMTVTHIGMPEGDMKEMSVQGLNESFDKMEAMFAS
jgi:uncharacterized protein YndB with AHSA1/START domain